MNKRPAPVITRTCSVEAFCLHCGVIQNGTLHPARFVSHKFIQQRVIVHCADCGGVSHHEGEVRVSTFSGLLSVIPDGDDAS